MLSNSLQETEKFAQQVLGDLKKNNQHVLLLAGDLGSGKTALVKKIGYRLGVVEPITSPTFVVSREYPLTKQTWELLLHVDLYRIGHASEQQIQELGLWEYIHNPAVLVCIEWPSQASVLSTLDGAMSIACEYVDEQSRIYTHIK